MDIPDFGAEMATESAARYELTDRKTGDLFYAQDIGSKGVVPWDYAFVGLIRARESINRSVQNNISQFLQALESIDITKPMLPTSAAAAK